MQGRLIMPHCTKCGAAIGENVAFCPACGASQAAHDPGPAASKASSGLQENVAGALAYALGWITGLIFFFIDKRPYVRFHAAQSIVVFGALSILSEILSNLFGFSFITGEWTGFSLGYVLWRLVHLAGVILWILLMVKAYQGERFRVPVAADVAEKIFGKS
jgi:uncharacterized membrane protein